MALTVDAIDNTYDQYIPCECSRVGWVCIEFLCVPRFLTSCFGALERAPAQTAPQCGTSGYDC
jgi:hypothetical protein